MAHVKVQAPHSIAQMFGLCGSNFQTEWTKKLPSIPACLMLPATLGQDEIVLQLPSASTAKPLSQSTMPKISDLAPDNVKHNCIQSMLICNQQSLCSL